MTNDNKKCKTERVSDAEMTMTGLGEPIIHIPHFQAREDLERPGRLMFFDTFFERDRLGNCYGEFSRHDIEQIAKALMEWVQGDRSHPGKA